MNTDSLNTETETNEENQSTTSQETNSTETTGTDNVNAEKENDTSADDLAARLELAERERESFREAAAKWKEYEDSQKTESQRTEEKLKEMDALRQENQALKLVAQYGIKAEDIELLGGGSLEDMEARAKRVAALYGGAHQPPPNKRPYENYSSGEGAQRTPANDAYPEDWIPAGLKTK